MAMRRFIATTAALLVVVASLTLFSDRAYAHERRIVGPYEIEVGWVDEPAYAGIPNGVFLHVAQTRGDAPVDGLAATLTVDAASGGLAPIRLAFQPIEHDPGSYRATFVPTSTGGYTFRLKGKIGTLEIDERFESGPSTFDDVRDVSVAQYPEKVPAAQALARRLDALGAAADQARLLGAVGALLGLAGVLVGVLALARSRA